MSLFLKQINVNQGDTDFLAWARRGMWQPAFLGPQVMLEGQTELQEDAGKIDIHRNMEKGKGQGLENRPKAQCGVSKFVQLYRRWTCLIARCHFHRVSSDTKGDVNKDYIFAARSKGSFHTHSITSPGLEPDSERKDSHEGNRRAVEIKTTLERLEEGQSCWVTASKYSEKQVQRAEMSLWNEFAQVKHTARLLNICK